MVGTQYSARIAKGSGRVSRRKMRPKPGMANCGVAALLATVVGTSPAAVASVLPVATSAAQPSADRDCFQELTRGRDAEIACVFPVRMTDEELASVRKATHDLLRDARCAMTIRIPRRLIDDAVRAHDHVFQAPAQPVTCDVVTSKSTLPITFTFAPRVEFKDGQAVGASPIMADVTGVSRVLSWPVVTYVNHSRDIRDGMIQVVNAYLNKYRPSSTAQRVD